MLKIRQEQMEVFEQATFEHFVCRIMEQVRSKYSDRLPALDTELRESVTAWITDARRWGFSTDSAITRYVDFCAQTQGQREPIETRLKTYLRLYHENLLGGVDAQEFGRTVMQLAARHKVHEEEGIAWLAVILLAGHLRSWK